MFVTLLKEVKAENGILMFKVTEYETVENAEDALEADEIRGYITIGEEYELTVRKSNLYSSIIKIFIDQYMQNEALIEQVAVSNPDRVQLLVQELFSETEKKME